MRMLGPFLVAVLLSTAHAAPVPKGAKKANFFPLEKGNRWVYDEDDDEKTTEVIDVSEENGVKLVTLKYTAVSGIVPTKQRVFRIQNDEIQSLRADSSEAEKPATIMRISIREGDEWNTEHQWRGNNGWKIKYKVGEAKVLKTPAGDIKAYPLASSSTQTGDETRWYADGVGLIRKEKDGKITADLKSFARGK